MKLVFTSLAIALASSSLATAAPAAEPLKAQAAASAATPSQEQRDLARQFVIATDPEKAILEMFRAGFDVGVAEEVKDEAVLTSIKPKLESYLSRLEVKLREKIPGLIDVYVELYAAEFSAEELRHMVAFATSPVGKHYMSRLPQLETDPAVMIATMQMMEDLSPVLEDIRKEVCADNAAKRMAAGDTKARCPLSEPEEAAG